jgi:precorrin-6B C5,15-methyltransferase / cobalt-precorrin-6B C5,C15-methyltransferase
MVEINRNTIAAPAAEQVTRRWLSVVGIGEDGVAGLSELARSLIQSAETVFGGVRHLTLAAPLIRGTARAWSNPLDRSVADIIEQRGRLVCVLASGDPFQYGIGSLLARHIAPDETLAIPALSAFSLAASRLLWPLQETTLLSLCGRPMDLIRPSLQPGARILALTSGASAPVAIAALLRTSGFGGSRMTVLESIGGPYERLRSTTAATFVLNDVGPLNTVAIEIVPDSTARILPRTSGLADEMFEHDGQITKREIRALTLSALAPRRGEHLWDVGAGSGSVAIEWMLADPSLTAVAIERRVDRAARIKRNSAALGVPDLQVLEGDAPHVLDSGLQTPNAVFIGGGATTTGVIDASQGALRSGGRLVVNAVTLDTEAVLLQVYAQHGGTLTRIEIQRAAPIGGRRHAEADEDSPLTSWRPARPITQWVWVKP